MAAIPFMPLYVADYLSDAAHLSTLEHGAYLLLIMTYWQRGEALPDDDKKLARICRLGPREWGRIRPSISEFFQVSCSGWSHRRIECELATVRAKSLNKRKGGLARAEQMHSNRLAPAKQSDTDTDTEGVETKVSTPSARGKSNPFPKPDWADQQVWNDWLQVRKNRGGRNTATAHAGFLTDIASLTNDEWPPGRLLQYAVTKSWAGIYAPKEGYPSGQPSIRAANDFTGLRGARPNPALDMVLQAERDLQAETECEDSQPDRSPRLALPPGERGGLEFAPGDAWAARGGSGAH